uniref:BAR domain-containing protein n=1 Tax=Panagrolaimus sp. PS1159 TaxID=55785 RepID=A0AC35F5C0_9BILA
MFSKVRRRLSSANKLPDLEVPVVKRIQLLSQIYDMTKSLLHDTREVIKMFDQEEGTLKNSTEAYASTLRVLGESVKVSNPEYTEFLSKQAEIYDELGHLQRRLQYELSVRVVTPLSGWLHADYARMNFELKRMYEKKTDYDSKTNEVARNPQDAGLILQQDLCRREYERQMEITKLELLRLSGIRNEHAKILSQFAFAWREYTNAAKKLFEELDSSAAPSKMSKSSLK